MADAPVDPAPSPLTPAEIEARHTAQEEEQLMQLYAELKPMAAEGYIQYFLARTPAHLQADMRALIEDDLATPPTAPGEGAPEAAAASPVPQYPPPA